MSKNERALRILKHIPFLVPADMRFQLFNTLIMADKEEVAQYRSWGGETRVTIRREFVFEDGYSSLAALPRKCLIAPNSTCSALIEVRRSGKT